ncbi:FtsK/SpoIIIE domain-containing protein [Priestia koreensis]|uniref:FtsK/SpoIIIE domain-containing protein n=1 Tax=Priestia koreensis TaxID=284581 RepID=UPI00301B3AA5
MIFEIVSSAVMGGVATSTYLYRHGFGANETQKIKRIAVNAGLVAKDGTQIRIHRRSRKAGRTEYVFQLPQGMSSNQFIEKLDRFQDGLNAKKLALDISLKDLKALKLRKDIFDQIKRLLEKKRRIRKEVEIKFDGMLRFTVYEEALTDYVPYDEALLRRVSGWEVPVGFNRDGQLIKHDFELTPHLVVGGGTRYGKSNYLNSLIVSLIRKHGENVSLVLVDLKGGIEFGDYENVEQVKAIAYEPEEALTALSEAYEHMKGMQRHLRSIGKKKVQDAGIAERCFVIIDEVGELNPAEAVTSKEKILKEQCQTYMSQIARLGAGLGLRLILATQYPTGDVIPRQCKQQSDAKLCFHVRNAVASRVVLDEDGAEDLPLIKGRAIYQTDQNHIVQTPYIDEKMISDTIYPYINIRGRKERADEETSHQDSAGRGDTLIIKSA